MYVYILRRIVVQEILRIAYSGTENVTKIKYVTECFASFMISAGAMIFSLATAGWEILI